MKFAAIAPTSAIKLVAERDFHLVLAHLIGDNEYTRAYRQIKQDDPNTLIILDNGAFELTQQGKPMFPADKLIGLAKQVDADYIVLPDYPGEPAAKTREAALKYADEFASVGYGSFYCPQSTVGDLQGLMEEFVWAFESRKIDYVGFSILNIPNAYGVVDDPLQRYLSRYNFVEDLNNFVVSTTKYHSINDMKEATGTKIHFLGMLDGPNEIELMSKQLDCTIDTWDSSSPVWAGFELTRYDNSPTGLKRGKVKSHVNFNRKEAEPIQLDDIYHNLALLDALVDGYNQSHSVEQYDVVPEISKHYKLYSEADINAEVTKRLLEAEENREFTFQVDDLPERQAKALLTHLNNRVGDVEPTAPSPYDFSIYTRGEGQVLNDILNYVRATYGEHYVSGDIQTQDVWQGCGTKMSTARDTIIKYAMRYGKKSGYNYKDLLKIVHYTIMMMSEHNRLNLGEKK